MNRRHFLQSSLVLAGAGLIVGNTESNALLTQNAHASTANQQQPNQRRFIDNAGELPQKHLTCYPDIEDGRHQLHQLWVLQDNSLLLSYRAHPSQKYPFFSPMAGPLTGLPLVTETGRPWPHHRGVFFGLDRVNGGNYWQDILPRGQIISQGPSFAKEDGLFKLSETEVNIVDRCLWRQGDADPIIEDHRKFLIKVLDDSRYVLDADITVKALADITVQQTNHGLFGVRSAPDLAPTGGGIMENSDGDRGMEATLGKPARWMALYGKRAKLREETVEGIAVFCPSKPPHPAFRDCPWFTRDYGNISPTPMNWLLARGDSPFRLESGEELKLRYRVVAFGGTPKDADLDGLWNEFDAKS